MLKKATTAVIFTVIISIFNFLAVNITVIAHGQR